MAQAMEQPTDEFFQYSDRLVTANSIRLLKFPNLRFDNTGDIELSIETFDINSLPIYHALSYTWGWAEIPDDANKPDETHMVRLNGKLFAVTVNLYDALMEIRNQGVEYCWIDAFCINQGTRPEDLEERSAQVNMMGFIYQRAKLVMIWLGLKNQATDSIVDLIKRLAQVWLEVTKDTPEYYKQSRMDELGVNQQLRRYQLPDLENDVWNDFIVFFERRWFSRMWIVQEVALAPVTMSQNHIVLWGDRLMHWETLSECGACIQAMGVQRHLQTRRRQMKKKGPIGLVGSSPAAISSVNVICHRRDPNVQSIYGNLAERMAGCKDVYGNISVIFIILLNIIRDFGCTDGRDKVFGLLGLLEKASEEAEIPAFQVRADYKMSIEDVFQATVVSIIEETQSIRLLGFLVDPSFRKLPELPSWVPDLTAIIGDPLITECIYSGAPAFDASGSSSRGFLGYSITGKTLSLKGKRLGTIQGKGEPYLDMNRTGNFAECSNLILSLPKEYRLTGQDRMEVFWRTLIGDQDENGKPAASRLGASFRDWLTTLAAKGTLTALRSGLTRGEYFTSQSATVKLASAESGPWFPTMQEMLDFCERCGYHESSVTTPSDTSSIENEWNVRVHPFASRIQYSCAYRCLFCTEEGLLGIGPQSLQAKDSVWIVSGSPTAMVLRAVEDECSPARFHVIGEAYVNGVMYGEAIDMETIWQDIQLV